jgi:hypothetical protein
MIFSKDMKNPHHIQDKNKATHKSTIGAYTIRRDHFWVRKTIIPQPTRLIPQQMDETREKELCLNCEKKYSKGHKCRENKLFYIYSEEEEDSIPQPTRLTPEQLDEIISKGLCLNCDTKHSKVHKCSENKLLYIDYEEEEHQESKPPQDPDLEDITPTIYFHALVNISTPQTIKIQGVGY